MTFSTLRTSDLTSLQHDMGLAVEFGESKRDRSSVAWLLTFSDLVLLLLTFFILLFAMSDIDLGRYGALSRSTGLSLSDPLRDETQSPTTNFTIPQQDFPPASDLGFLKAVVSDALSKDARFGRVSTRLTEEYLVLSLPGSLLFEAGSADIGEQARAALFDLAGLLSALENEVAVTGHVGPEGFNSTPFLTTWELSLARAVRVSDVLSQSGYQGEMRVFGRADLDFKIRSQNLPAAARNALAEAADRVDIVIFPYVSGV